MPSMDNLPPKERADLTARLKKIEGQARGIQRMIDEGRECVDVMNQVASMKAAVTSLSGELLELYALHCIRNPESFASPEDAIEQAVKMVIRNSR